MVEFEQKAPLNTTAMNKIFNYLYESLYKVPYAAHYPGRYPSTDTMGETMYPIICIIAKCMIIVYAQASTRMCLEKRHLYIGYSEDLTYYATVLSLCYLVVIIFEVFAFMYSWFVSLMV